MRSAEFWLAALVGALVKITLSEKTTWRRWFVQVATAIGTAWAMTDATLGFFDLDAETYGKAAAAIWAIMGEGIARQAIDISERAGLLGRFWKGSK